MFEHFQYLGRMTGQTMHVKRSISFPLFFIALWSIASSALCTTLAQEEIQNAYLVRKKMVSGGDTQAANRQLDIISDLQKKYGFSALPEITLSLIQEIHRQNKTPENAQTELDYARRFDPNSPLPDYYLCEKGLTYLSHCFSGLKKEWALSSHRLSLLSNITFFISLFLSFLFVLIVFLSALENLRSHELFWKQSFPEITRTQNFLAHLAMLTLLGLSLGILGCVLWMVITLSHRFKSVDLIALMVVCLLFLLLPLIFYFPAYTYKANRDVYSILQDPFRGSKTSENEQVLLSWTKTHPKDSQSLFTLARIYNRTQKLEDAKKIYENLMNLDPSWAKPKVNLAIVYHQMQMNDEAIELLKKIIQNHPSDSMKANFNLGQLYIAKAEIDLGRKYFDQAKEVNPSLLTALQEESKANHFLQNLVEEKLDENDLNPRLWNKSKEIIHTRDQLFAQFFPQLPLPWFYVWVLGFFSWSAFLLFRPKNVYRQTSAKVTPADLNIFGQIQGPSSLPFFSEEQLEVFKYKWSSFILPGSHFFFSNRKWIGILLIACTCFFSTLLFTSTQRLVAPDFGFELKGFPFEPFAIAGLVIVYLSTLTHSLRKN